MPEPSWEVSASAWAHGFLKFLDFQSDGFDVHATFQKSKAIHVSVYAVGTTSDAKLAMQTMVIGVSGVALEASKRTLLKHVVSPSADMPEGFWAFFEDRCTRKATELNILAPQQTIVTTTAPITATAQKGGGSGIPSAAKWGDQHRQQQFNAQFPSLGSKG